MHTWSISYKIKPERPGKYPSIKEMIGLFVLMNSVARVTWARTWNDVIRPLPLPDSTEYEKYLVEDSPQSTMTWVLSSFPSVSHSDVPSSRPSQQPSIAPSSGPTRELSASPTSQPTELPSSSPSEAPSGNPTHLSYIVHPWDFNYNTGEDAVHGPRAWSEVATSSNPNFYWKEFDEDGFGPWKGSLAKHTPSINRCGKDGLQSPIDVRENEDKCMEHHEVRSLRGDYSLKGNTGGMVKKQIQSNKLRILYERRPCADFENVTCQEPDPPHADFPNGWGGYADVMHVDFKVPSEHWMHGEQFDAEMQIFHLHANRKRMPTQASLVRATLDGHNAYFQEVLNIFQHEFDRDSAMCAEKMRRSRQLVSELLSLSSKNSTISVSHDLHAWAQFSTTMDDPNYPKRSEQMERKLGVNIWDPHHESLVPSIYFYRYDGSLTEPPCGEWVTWFICDEPMTISFDQLDSLKNILFNHVDADCKKTSVHNRHGSVARPIQKTAGRPVWKCTSNDFAPDELASNTTGVPTMLGGNPP